MGSEKDISTPTDDALLVEYQAAQNSAQHHDNLIWSINGVVWAASLVLLGLLLKLSPNRTMVPVMLLISLLGVFLVIQVWTYTYQLKDLKKQKYERCKEIERKLNLRQHSSVSWKSGRQWLLYNVIMIFFILIWLFVGGTYLQTWLCQCH